MLRSFGALLAQAGWAPTLVFLAHVVASRFLDAYGRFPLLDVPMHFVGGIAIAYFFYAAIRRLPSDAIGSRYRSALQCVAVFSLTSTAAVFWEFAEFISDRYFGTCAQLELEDTLLDMSLGIAGGLVYLAFAQRSANHRRGA